MNQPGPGFAAVGAEKIRTAAAKGRLARFRRHLSSSEPRRGPEIGRDDLDPLPRQNRTGILEHGPCRHPLAALLATAMDLEAVVQVECAAGCCHRLYSDRGPVGPPATGHRRRLPRSPVSCNANQRLSCRYRVVEVLTLVYG